MATEMTPLQNLHYAIGELAYAMACADGEIQKAERQKFHDIMKDQLKEGRYLFDVSSIIFQVMDKEQACLRDVYDRAMSEMRSSSHYLSPGLKDTFIRLLEAIAAAFPPVTEDEQKIVQRFKNDISVLKGDPIYYGSGL